jgi:TetR/AcrR family transcriptional regulator, cholesterol catabolism regulator
MPPAEEARAPTSRDLQKAETRAKVMEAARSLFAEIGYQASTIREIAKRAGVAPGSVFTTFESKADLLLELSFLHYDDLLAELRAIASDDASSVTEKLGAIGAAAYRFHFDNLRLHADQIGASWTWDVAADRRHAEKLAPLERILVGVLSDGQSRGELRRDLDLDLAGAVIFAAWLQNLRHALFAGATVSDLTALFARQLSLLAFAPGRPT